MLNNGFGYNWLYKSKNEGDNEIEMSEEKITYLINNNYVDFLSKRNSEHWVLLSL